MIVLNQASNVFGTLLPVAEGGTGSRSEYEEQPDFLPDICESGTQNAVGLAGLEAEITWLLDEEINAIRAQEIQLTQQLLNGLQSIPGVTVYGSLDAASQTATVLFNLEGMAPSKVGLCLDGLIKQGCDQRSIVAQIVENDDFVFMLQIAKMLRKRRRISRSSLGYWAAL